MKLNLLGSPLKGDVMLQTLEHYDMEITYHVDRLFENQPDSYSSYTKAAGFSFTFDAQQTLETIFCYIADTEGFSPVDRSMIGVPLDETVQEARLDADRQKIRMTQGGWGAAFDRIVDWARLDWPDHARHYELERGELRLVTLMTEWPR